MEEQQIAISQLYLHRPHQVVFLGLTIQKYSPANIAANDSQELMGFGSRRLFH